MLIRALLFLLLLAPLAAVAQSQVAQSQVAQSQVAQSQVAQSQVAQSGVVFETGTVTVVTEAGERHDFQVELALSGPQMARGLMFRESLAPDAGMLFVFPSPRTASFWMKNTLIPLDMLFIARDGRVVHVAERTTPLSERGVSSRRPVIAVLELAGGTAERLGIAAGATVESDTLP